MSELMHSQRAVDQGLTKDNLFSVIEELMAEKRSDVDNQEVNKLVNLKE